MASFFFGRSQPRFFFSDSPMYVGARPLSFFRCTSRCVHVRVALTYLMCATQRLMYTYVICSSGAQGVRPFFPLGASAPFFLLRVLAGMSKAHSLGTNTSLVWHGGGVLTLSLDRCGDEFEKTSARSVRLEREPTSKRRYIHTHATSDGLAAWLLHLPRLIGSGCCAGTRRWRLPGAGMSPKC